MLTGTTDINWQSKLDENLLKIGADTKSFLKLVTADLGWTIDEELKRNFLRIASARYEIPLPFIPIHSFLGQFFEMLKCCVLFLYSFASIYGKFLIVLDEEEFFESITVSPPEIYKLNIGCLQEVFEWLTLEELIRVAKTCERMHQAAGDFYRSHYVSQHIRIDGSDHIQTADINLDIFIEYIPSLKLDDISARACRRIDENSRSIKHFFTENSLDTLSRPFQLMKNMVKHVEWFHFQHYEYSDVDFYEDFMKYFSSIKRLSLSVDEKPSPTAIIGSSNEWMLREYPTLRHLQLFNFSGFPKLKHNELILFFNNNPNLQSFCTDTKTFLNNKPSFLASNIKLDKLSIKYVRERNKSYSKRVLELLIELHKRGFYKRLHLDNPSQTELDQICSSPISYALEFLALYEKIRINIPIINLKVLVFSFLANARNEVILKSKNVASLFPKLERIDFGESENEIVASLCSLPKLKAIKTYNLGPGDFNLLALNKEREKLKDAKKVIIYIEEELFLERKNGNLPIDSNLIELRRMCTDDFSELFYYIY